MACRLRLWNPEWTNVTTLNQLRKSDVHGKRSSPYVEIMYFGTASAAAAEVGAAADSAKDGTATPFRLNIVSSSADDTDNSAKDCRAVRVIGVSAANASATAISSATTGRVVDDWATNNQYTVEEIRTAGTTDVYSTRFWIRVMHVYACEFGSAGADAKGNITAESPANTTLLTIAAGATESNGSAIYGAYGHNGRMTYLRISSSDVAWNNA
jgi:hypothetical protein